MSITRISPNLVGPRPSAIKGNFRPIRQDFQNLAEAPTSGDLTGAKDAFTAMQQLLQSSGSGKANQPQGSGHRPQNPASTDLMAFGKALVSGVLGTAKDSVNGLIGEIQAARSRSQTQGGEGVVNSISASSNAGHATGGKSIGSFVNVSV